MWACVWSRARVCLVGEMIPVPVDILKGAAGRGKLREDEERDGGRDVFSWQLRTRGRQNMPVQRQARSGTLKVCTCTRTVESRLYFISFSCWHPLLEQTLLFGRCSFFPFAFLPPPPAVLTLEGPLTEYLFSAGTSQRCREKKTKKKNISSNPNFNWKSWSLEFQQRYFDPLVLCPGRGRCSAEISCFFFLMWIYNVLWTPIIGTCFCILPTITQ